MKRKLTLIFLSIVCALCLCFGLTACGGNSDDETSDWQNGLYSVQTAYAEAQSYGYSGTLEQFIASITGADGKDGTDGQDGTDGIGIADVSINADGELVVTLSTSYEINLGDISGADGVGISTVAIENGNLIITLTDGSNINCGSVVGEDGEDGNDGVGISSVAFNADGELIVTFTNGTTTNLGDISGTDGTNGTNGQDGVGVSSVVINSDGQLVITLSDNTEINCGTVVGTNGTNGTDGQNGADGISIVSAYIDTDGNLTLTFSNGNPVVVGNVVGASGSDGTNGQDGVGVSSVVINSDGQLVITLTDETIINCGTVVGTNGTNGTDGEDGDSISEANIDANGNLILTFTSGKTITVGNVVGASGSDGADGQDGADGVGVSSVVINSNGQLVITLTDSTEINCGTVVGTNGSNGVGISEVVINSDGELVITYTNGTVYNLGNVKGTDGTDGVGVESVDINSNGEVVVTYTDGSTHTAGSVYCNHSYGEWITGKEATCTSIGYNYRICSICGDIEYVFIEATGHTADEYTYDESFHYYVCTDCDLYITQAHTFENSICKICGYEADYSIGLAYELNSDKKSYTVTGIGTCTDTDIVIPSIYKGLPVTAIGDGALMNNTSLISVDIGDSVTSIGEYAFGDCFALISITIGTGVTSIGWGAFSSCGSVTAIYFNATNCDDFDGWSYHPFQGCGRDGVGFTLYIGSNVKSIPAYFMAWKQSSSPYEAKIIAIIFEENSVCESIGQRAFEGCVSLTNITIPNSVTSIGWYAFYDCYKLVEVYNLSSIEIVVGSSTEVSSDGSSVFYGSVANYALNVYTATSGDTHLITDGDYLFIYDDDNNYYLVSYYGTETDIVLPDSINGNNYSIYQYAFYNYYDNYGYLSPSYITSITIPDGVTTIGYGAFYGCTSLTNITISDSVTSIGESAFYNTAYYNNTDNWEDCVLYIGNYLIKADTSISGSCEIKDGTTVIAAGAFNNCTSLISIIIPDSVISIGNEAFAYCISLTSVYYSGTASQWASISFGSSAANPLYYAGNLYLNGTLATDITLEGITSINAYEFEGCTSLTSVTIGSSVTSIDKFAFYGCNSLTSIIISDSVTLICTSAFYNCKLLTSVYYTGTADEWSGITFGDSSYSDPTYYGATLYYYSEEEPNYTDGYNYWHYVDGEVVIWTVEAE